MNSYAFSVLFVSFLLISLALQFWLKSRHIRHVLKHRDAVPARFADKIPLQAHQKAADYTIAKTKLGLVESLFSYLVLLGFTLFGGLQWLSVSLLASIDHGLLHSVLAWLATHIGSVQWLGRLILPLDSVMTYQICLIFAYMGISGVLNLPFDYYSQFVLEERFGFNKMTIRLWLIDMVKWTLLGLCLFTPLIWIVLSLMAKAGDLWWLYAWAVWMGFNILLTFIFPNVIAPLFNKFTPLEDQSLTRLINDLLQRIGFKSKGLFVMDGSRRSAHGNAYFSGFGSTKRIVFYDTLLTRLAPEEIEAVLAHELGHFKLKHILKAMVRSFILSLGFLFLLGYLKQQGWFYSGLGVEPLLSAQQSNDAMALLLIMLCMGVFGFIFSPLFSLGSRKHEFEADAFAAKYADGGKLISALVKMYEDNASTLTPDPLHSAFYDSHPPATIRIDHLTATAASAPGSTVSGPATAS